MGYFFGGIILCLIGIGGRLLVARRKFYRRNEAGIEEYNNYTSALANSAFNKTIGIVANITIFVGVVFIFFVR